MIVYKNNFIKISWISLYFSYSYGYDCKKYFNLVAPDESTVVFASGNLINFYNVQTNRMQFRRSYLGGGIGHITLNPCKKYSHLTVAENGDNPPIIIYEWPSMNIVGILKEGAARRFAHINYRSVYNNNKQIEICLLE